MEQIPTRSTPATTRAPPQAPKRTRASVPVAVVLLAALLVQLVLSSSGVAAQANRQVSQSGRAQADQPTAAPASILTPEGSHIGATATITPTAQVEAPPRT